ncbi:MAG: signal peptidase II [Marmoricola sp.]
MQAARGASLTSDSRPITRTPRLGSVLVVALIAWAVDLGSKILVVHQLTGHAPVDVVGSLLRLNLTRNAGAAFSTGTSVTPVITVFAIVALVAVLILARRTGDLVWAWAMGLLLAGIGGNLTDRLFRDPGPLRGHVVDFLELPHWPVFNVADVCITAAAVLIVVQAARNIPLAGPAGPAGPTGSAGAEDNGPAEDS